MTKTDKPGKKKIAVLGGGMGALSTVFELTDYPGWQDHYDITVYQMGWRLGGKCATGRGDNDRIEEHGIHIFLGFYNNAIRMVRLAYDEWAKTGKLSPDFPFQSWETIFHLQNSIMLPEFIADQRRWENWVLVFPENNLVPGIGAAPSKQVNIKKMLLLMMELILGSPYLQKKRGCLSGWVHQVWRKIFPREKMDVLPGKQPDDTHYQARRGAHPHWWSTLEQDVLDKTKHIEASIEHKYLHHAKTLIAQLPESEDEAARLTKITPDEPHLHTRIAKLFEEFVIKTEKKIYRHISNNPDTRRFWILAQLGMINLKGLENDCYDPQTGTYDFNRINHLDYRDWLKKWGATEEVIYSAPVKDLYALVFAYPSGDTSLPGQLEAGTAILGAMLIILGYKGAVLHRFHGGTADVIVTPLYQVLMARGVKVKFFHKVQEIKYSAGEEIEEILMDEQVRLTDEHEDFKPNRVIHGMHCWPSHPFWRWQELADQIHPDDLDQLKAKDIDLESNWNGWKPAKTHRLIKGIDFDQIVLGISKEGLRDICGEIISKKPAWSTMMEKVKTVQTQALQIWLDKNLAELGMDLPSLGMLANDSPVLDTYVDPINSYADMSELLRWESWPAWNQPKSLAYFCGPLYEDNFLPLNSFTAFPEEQLSRVRQMSFQWLNDNTGFLWPIGVQKTNPSGLDYNLLSDPLNEANTDGRTKLERQFYKANIDPSERYVLSVPGSGRHRLKTDGSGFRNLFLAGDWIETGYNMGCVECAVISGLLAAQAVRRTYGFTEHKPIIKDL